jgi:hypothetical protein
MVVPVSAPRADEPVVRALLEDMRERRPGHRVLGIRAAPEWSGPAELHFDGGRARATVWACVSTLEVHEALCSRVADDYLVILTDRPDNDLGLSVVARLYGQRLMELDLWVPVLRMFRATTRDPRLAGLGDWVAPALLGLVPPGGWPVAPTGTLTYGHAMSCLAGSALGPDRLDASGLLMWSLDRGAVSHWRECPDQMRTAITTWLVQGVGPVAKWALLTAQQPHGIDAVSLGLAADVLWPSPEPAEADGALEAPRAVFAALECGLVRPTPQEAREWADAARAVTLRLLDAHDPATAGVMQRAAAVLGDVGWRAGVVESDLIEAGLDARLHRLAGELLTAWTSRGEGGPSAGNQVETAWRRVHEHAMSGADDRAVRAAMAVRLSRWLTTPEQEMHTLAEAIREQIQVGAWVDTAAAMVWVGEADGQLAGAYRVLSDAVTSRRTRQDARFAQLLAQATRSKLLPTGVIGVEDVLDQIVRPLTAASRVALVVIDGMSAANAVQIGEDLAAAGWYEMQSGDAGRLGVLAALPTVTAVSRTSLLCGQLRSGQQADEKAEFPKHTSGHIFHKDDLRASAGRALPESLVAAMSDRAVPIVCTVLNTIDDSLKAADPGGTSWNLANIQHLQAIAALARDCDRALVLVSDHGHVVERGSSARPSAGADARFRPVNSGPVAPDEVELAGPRVLAFGGQIIAAAQEGLRYTRKAAGYHGGATPAEAVIPLLVHVRRPDSLAGRGWSAAPPPAPLWWTTPVTADTAVADDQPPDAGPPTARRPARTEFAGQGELFADIPEQATPGRPPQHDPTDALIKSVMSSDIWSAQRSRNTRGAFSDEQMAAVLRLLLQGSGRAHRDALLSVLHVPRTSWPGALQTLRKALNVEQYPVLEVDLDGVTVLLDEALLREQFGAVQRP